MQPAAPVHPYICVCVCVWLYIDPYIRSRLRVPDCAREQHLIAKCLHSRRSKMHIAEQMVLLNGKPNRGKMHTVALRYIIIPPKNVPKRNDRRSAMPFPGGERKEKRQPPENNENIIRSRENGGNKSTTYAQFRCLQAHTTKWGHLISQHM
ncbi:exodeoxyribonuclease V, alpha subunit [Anopheles sinensis]|uniref:Exodeoxyribonuclease V, alpha subunit n=1 Tax=Anopheles sinensis TaxID=74873 RepID=A0A084WQV3_ANOSI|nr:exodeoxyribonuclease V, alpha subunit [Anopheles sinensis]